MNDKKKQEKEDFALRFVLVFRLDKPEIPIEYRKSVLSFIKAALNRCDNGKYFEKYYKDTIHKNFTWFTILKEPRFTKENIILSSTQLKIVFSVENNNKSGYILFMALNSMKNSKFPLKNNNFMTLENIQKKSQSTIFSEKCIFKTCIGSPCIIREHNKELNKDYYYSIKDKDFNKILTDSLRRQALREGFSEEESESISAKMINGKKTVVKHYDQYIDANIGLIEIEAKNYILQHFYEVGICSRRSAGFGAIELISEKE